MAIEIQILSGSRQGERIVLDAGQITIGDDNLCDVVFDPEADPPAKDRLATLQQTSEGWYIRSTGAGQILLNQSAVTRKTRIRSGDLVRLSKLGPDFSFNILSHATGNVVSSSDPVRLKSSEPLMSRPDAAETGMSADAPVVDVDSAIEDTSTPSVEATASPALPTPIQSTSVQWQRFLLLGVGLAIGAAIIVMAVSMIPDSGSQSSLMFEPISDQTMPEDTELSGQLRVKKSGASDTKPVFALVGQPPKGAHIDRETGVFTWKPTETDGPGRYPIRAQATAGDNQRHATEMTFFVDVLEVNVAPVIQAIEKKTVKAGEEIAFSITVTDPDQPANRLHFRMSDAPDWMAIDANSGIVRCFPPKTADGPYEVSVHVADDGTPPLESAERVQIEVRGDPWIRVEKEVREAVYLIQVGKDGTKWPFATCCAIGDHTLVTTARVTSAVVNMARAGFRIHAVCPSTGTETAIRAFLIDGSIPTLENSPKDRVPEDWRFVNLGLLQTEQELPKTARLASRDELHGPDRLTEGLRVGSIGIPHDGSKITPQDSFAPKFTLAKIFFVRASPDPLTGRLLIELKATFPENVVGSPVFTSSAGMVAIYDEKVPGKGVKDLHYAPVLDLSRLQSWLDGTGADNWVPLSPLPKIPSDLPQQPSSGPDGP